MLAARGLIGSLSLSLSLLLAPAPAGAKRAFDPLRATQLDAAAPLPAGIRARGAQVREVWTWTNPDGAPGYLVLSATSSDKTNSRQVFGQVFAGARPRQVRLIQDGVRRCKLVLAVNFVAGSVSVGDADGDGTPEIAFAYDLACGATADPWPRKLIVLEGKAKHALRGRGMGADPDDKPYGGDYQVDGFRREDMVRVWAETRWKALLATGLTPYE